MAVAMQSLRDVAFRALTVLFRQGPLSQAKLEAAWRTAVGGALSNATSVRLREAGVVEATAVDQRWHRELRRSSAMILDRLNSLLGAGAVTRLVLLGGPAAPRRTPAKPQSGKR
jgi:predicted nucleic acid-binding Zn ribbon protein